MSHPSSSPPQLNKKELIYLPMRIPLKNSKNQIIIDWYTESDRDQVYAILKQIIDQGQSYPRNEFDEKIFEHDYLCHVFFTARCSETGGVLGYFYIRPKFPGRSSHICVGGFGVREDQRRKGIGEILYKTYLRIARDVGYEASLFSIVFVANKGSVNICRRLGFTEIGVIPRAGKLEGIGYSDAMIFYYDLTTLNDVGEPPCGWPR